MEVSRLAVSASTRGKLISAGYTCFSSLSSLSASHLATELKIPEKEAEEILKLASHNGKLDNTKGAQAVVSDHFFIDVRGLQPVGYVSGKCLLYFTGQILSPKLLRSSPQGGQTAWDMLKEDENLRCITTSCAALDKILGGGINCKEVTEIGGVPGIGKTQLGIQLAINVQIPHEHGGLAAKAIYIDTEGSFMVERALQIAEACLSDYYELPRRGSNATQPIRQPKDLLENIYYFRVCSYTEQVALINYLGKFIREHKEVKIVIVDSITFHFRQDFENMALRTRLLSELALKLMKLANDFKLAVVLLNQVTTKYSDGSVHLTLALGDSWSHACTNRIILHWNGNERYAYIDKSPTLQSSSAQYAVTGKGIRDSVSDHKRVKLL